MKEESKKEIIEFGNMGLLQITGVIDNVIISSVEGKTFWNGEEIVLQTIFSKINTCSTRYKKTKSNPFGTMELSEQKEIEDLMNELYDEWIETEESQKLLEYNKNIINKITINEEYLEKFHKEFLNPTDINSLNDMITNMALQTNKPQL